MACPLCGDRCTCSFARDTIRVSAPPSLTYEYDDDYPDQPAVNTNSEIDLTSVILNDDAATSVILSEDAAISASAFGALAASESKDPVFPPAFAPPEDLTLESARRDPVDSEAMWKQEVASRALPEKKTAATPQK